MVSKILLATIVIIVVAVILISMYIYIRSVTTHLIIPLSNQSQFIGPPGNGPIHIPIEGVLYYNNSASLVAYAVIQGYSFKNTSSANLRLYLYKRIPQPKIWVAQLFNNQNGFSQSVYCIDCLDEKALFDKLNYYLNKYDLFDSSFKNGNLNWIGLGDLPKLPKNSVIILPSGRMPQGLLPYTGKLNNSVNFTLLDLLDRGDTIVYVGQDFSQYVSEQINVGHGTPTDALGALKNYTLNTNSTGIYSELPNLYFNSSNFSFAEGQKFGPITYRNLRNGTIIAFGNYPKAAWPNVTVAASDIAYILNTRFWLSPITSGNLTISNSSSGDATIFTVDQPLVYTSYTPTTTINNSYDFLTAQLNNAKHIINSSYQLLTIQLNGANNTTKIINENFTPSIRIKDPYSSTISLPPRIALLSTINVNMVVPISGGVKVYQIFIAEPNVTNPDTNYLTRTSAGNPPTPNTTTISLSIGCPFSPDYRVLCIPSGNYIASFEDLSGKTYARALFYIPHLQISTLSTDFAGGVFTFNVSNNGQPVTGVNFTAYLDNHAYNSNGIINNSRLVYRLPKYTPLPLGNHTAYLSILGTSYSIQMAYQTLPQQLRIPPMYIYFGVAILFVAVFNLLARAPERDDYFIDVPNFPPTKKAEVHISSSEIVNLFDTINYTYHWKYMPLTIEEVKVGIGSNIRANNMYVSVTSENTVELLYKLISKKLLETTEDYYMPAEWTTSSKHDIEYLVIFRKLRDFSVQHSMLFTDLDAAENEDMIITKEVVQSRIFIYSSASGVRDIKLVTGSRSFIVFINEETLAEFKDKVQGSYGVYAEILKIGITSSAIKLVSTEDLSQLLF